MRIFHAIDANYVMFRVGWPKSLKGSATPVSTKKKKKKKKKHAWTLLYLLYIYISRGVSHHSHSCCSQVPMGIGLATPVHSAIEWEGGDTNRYQAAWRAGRAPSRTRGQKKCVQFNHGKCSYRPCCNLEHVCLLCLQAHPSRIIASSRKQPSRNRISGSQRIR